MNQIFKHNVLPEIAQALLKQAAKTKGTGAQVDEAIDRAIDMIKDIPLLFNEPPDVIKGKSIMHKC